DLLLSARHGWDDQDDQRNRLQAENVGRRHGRSAGHRLQDPARPAAQRRRQFRNLASGQVDGISRIDGAPEEISVAYKLCTLIISVSYVRSRRPLAMP